MKGKRPGKNGNYCQSIMWENRVMIIIPDVHGRRFWIKPVKEHLGKEHIVFLGDYLDPYRDENIPEEVVFSRFQDILTLKKNHPNDITLLLGNHDLHYLSSHIEGGRFDVVNSERNKRMFTENISLFQLAYEAKVGGVKYLFTHAGILWGWIISHNELFGKIKPNKISSKLNELWRSEESKDELYKALGDIPLSRWGRYLYGSPVWSDVDDMDVNNAELPGFFQVFGHTQQEYRPIINDFFACLDCRRAFQLTESGDFIKLDF